MITITALLLLFYAFFHSNRMFTDDAEDEPVSLILKKDQPRSNWDDEDVDDDGVKESWEDEDEPEPVCIEGSCCLFFVW